MQPVGRVDVSGLKAALDLLRWSPSEPGAYAMIEKWPSAMPVEPVFEVIAALYPGRRRGMTCFSNLLPGQFIEPHCDRHDSDCEIRVHIPIVTNPSCVFISDNHAFHMAAGWVWEINPSKMHCTGNGGETERVHLFFNMRAP